MAKLQEHVAKGTQQLAENTTKTQNELSKLQRELQVASITCSVWHGGSQLIQFLD